MQCQCHLCFEWEYHIVLEFFTISCSVREAWQTWHSRCDQRCCEILFPPQANWSTITFGLNCARHDLYRAFTRSSQGEELFGITLFTNIQMQYMTFESTTISSCSFFPLESEVKYLALLLHLRIILVHPELKLHSYRRYSAILGFVILEWNKFLTRWLETVFLRSFRYTQSSHRTKFHPLQSNAFHTCVEYGIEIWYSGRYMVIFIDMLMLLGNPAKQYLGTV